MEKLPSQTQRLIPPPNAGSLPGFGRSVSVNLDNTVAVIGARDDGTTGAAYIYTKVSGVWLYSEKLTPSGSNANEFGDSVSISHDGTIVAIGDPGDDAFYIFTRTGGVWSESTRVSPPGVASSLFGHRVKLSGDGSRLLVAALNDVNQGAANGACYVYENSGGWTLISGKIVGNEIVATPQQFGWDIDFNAAGTTALIGAKSYNGGDGAMYIFDGNAAGTTWTNTYKRTGSSASSFGSSVALNAAGTLCFVGSQNASSNEGLVVVYEKQNGTWSQIQILVPSDGGNNLFGRGVTCDCVGNSLAVIAEPGGATAGYIYTFYRATDGTFSQQSRLEGSLPSGTTTFSLACTMAPSGNEMIAGSPSDDSGEGATYVFRLITYTAELYKKITPPSGQPVGSSQFGAAVAIDDTSTTIVVGASLDDSQVGAGYVFSIVNGTWTQDGTKLVPNGNIGSGRFGSAVSISGNGSVIAFGAELEDANDGATYVFEKSGGTWSQVVRFEPNGTNSQLGGRVALNSDGNVLLASASAEQSVYVYEKLGGTWQYSQKMKPSISSTNFGKGLSLSGDGSTACIGAFNASPNGRIFIFENISGNWTQTVLINAIDTDVNGGTSGLRFGFATAMSYDGTTAVVGTPFDENSPPDGAVLVFSNFTGSWAQVGSKLTVTDSGSLLGHSVSTDKSGTKIVAGGYVGDSSAGFMYQFSESNGVWSQLGSKITPLNGVGSGQLGRSASMSVDGRLIVCGASADDSNAGAVYIGGYPEFSTTVGTRSDNEPLDVTNGLSISAWMDCNGTTPIPNANVSNLEGALQANVLSNGAGWASERLSASSAAYIYSNANVTLNTPSRYFTSFYAKANNTTANFTTMKAYTGYPSGSSTLASFSPEIASDGNFTLATNYDTLTISTQLNTSSVGYMSLDTGTVDMLINGFEITGDPAQGMQGFSASNTEQPANCFDGNTCVYSSPVQFSNHATLNKEAYQIKPVSEISASDYIVMCDANGKYHALSAHVLRTKTIDKRVGVSFSSDHGMMCSPKHILLVPSTFLDRHKDKIINAPPTLFQCAKCKSAFDDFGRQKRCKGCSETKVPGFKPCHAVHLQHVFTCEVSRVEFVDYWYHLYFEPPFTQCAIVLPHGVTLGGETIHLMSEPFRHALGTASKRDVLWKRIV